MSTLSVNSVNSYYANNNSNSRQSDYQNLSNALQTGNLSAAQTAYSALQQTLQNQGSTSTSQPSGQTNPISTDFQSLGAALNSGNLSASQQAFSQLQQAIQSARGGHHHHHGGGSKPAQDSSATPSSTSATSAGSESGSTLNVQA